MVVVMRRSRVARNAAGWWMWLGHADLVWRMSVFKASTILLADQAFGVNPVWVRVSQIAPMWVLPGLSRPWHRVISSAARRCSASGRGWWPVAGGLADRFWVWWAFFVRDGFFLARVRAVGEFLPT